MTHAKEVRCPLCDQVTTGAKGPQHRPSSLGKALSDLLEDVEMWAEGDVIANDGQLLNAADLVTYLANELAPPLMKVYTRKLIESRKDEAELRRRAEKEREQVQAVNTERPIGHGAVGRPRLSFCKRGHQRLLAGRSCGECQKERRALTRKLNEDSNASA